MNVTLVSKSEPTRCLHHRAGSDHNHPLCMKGPVMANADSTALRSGSEIERQIAALQSPRPTHVSRLIALAIKFQSMLRDGIVRDQTELARVTQPRMTQILNLTFLAPDIQEAILFLKGDTTVSEKALRSISVELSWAVQHEMWYTLLTTAEDSTRVKVNRHVEPEQPKMSRHIG